MKNLAYLREQAGVWTKGQPFVPQLIVPLPSQHLLFVFCREEADDDTLSKTSPPPQKTVLLNEGGKGAKKIQSMSEHPHSAGNGALWDVE